MSDKATAPRTAADVLAYIRCATHAVKRQDMDGMIEGLTAAVHVYEQHPSHVHQRTSHLADLLLCIRSGRTLCMNLGRPDAELAALEQRAEALRRPLH